MALSAAARHARPAAVLLVDVDNFKSVNSELGYEAGDNVLCEIAKRLASSIRAEDTVGRWGGEEFLVVLPETSRDVAVIAAERLRSIVGGAPVDTAAGTTSVTVSVGVAVSTHPSHAAIVRAADDALRRAKSDGRDRVRAS